MCNKLGPDLRVWSELLPTVKEFQHLVHHVRINWNMSLRGELMLCQHFVIASVALDCCSDEGAEPEREALN